MVKIRKQLVQNHHEFFYGDKAILQNYQKEDKPSKSFINRTLKDAKLTEPRHKRQPGASRYLHYPDYSLKQLGDSMLEIDFIGEKFIKGQTEPINFIAFAYTKPVRLRQFKRILAANKDYAIIETIKLFKRFFIPDYAKVDNGLAFIGSASAKRSLSDFILFLFKYKVIPIFTAPRKPWNQASVEGANSVFTKKFWNKRHFSSVTEIDQQLELFNQAYLRYSEFNKSQIPKKIKKKFKPQVYFIRKVYEDERTDNGYIEVLNEQLIIPKSYINLFVLACWDLKTEILNVVFEKDKRLILIKKYRFPINLLSKKKVSHFI